MFISQKMTPDFTTVVFIHPEKYFPGIKIIQNYCGSRRRNGGYSLHIFTCQINFIWLLHTSKVYLSICCACLHNVSLERLLAGIATSKI